MPTSTDKQATLIHLNNERQRLTAAFDEAIAYSQDPNVDPVVTAYRLALDDISHRIALIQWSEVTS